MSKHCKNLHGSVTMYLRKGYKPISPYHMDWWQKVTYPQPIFIAESAQNDESDESEYINTDEMIGADIIKPSDHDSVTKKEFVTPGEIEASEAVDDDIITPKKDKK